MNSLPHSPVPIKDVDVPYINTESGSSDGSSGGSQQVAVALAAQNQWRCATIEGVNRRQCRVTETP